MAYLMLVLLKTMQKTCTPSLVFFKKSMDASMKALSLFSESFRPGVSMM